MTKLLYKFFLFFLSTQMESEVKRARTVQDDQGSSSSESRKKQSKKHKKHKKKKHKEKKSSQQDQVDKPVTLSNTPSCTNEVEEEDFGNFGPAAPFSLASSSTTTGAGAPQQYGDHLLSGEGPALAEFIRRNERIPRRGEVGYDGDRIQQFEELGYVMSGSRHKRMEAVRKRKENQIFSAEEKRLLLISETKKRQEKESKVLEEMRHLIRKKEHEDAARKL